MASVININELNPEVLSYYKTAKGILYMKPGQLEFLPLNDDYTKLAVDTIMHSCRAPYNPDSLDKSEIIKLVKYNKDEVYSELLWRDNAYFEHFVDPSFEVCIDAYSRNKKTLSYMDIHTKRRIKKYPLPVLRCEMCINDCNRTCINILLLCMSIAFVVGVTMIIYK